MSMRVEWQHGGAVEDQIMDDVESWHPASFVWQAGRQVSDWLFGKQPVVSPFSTTEQVHQDCYFGASPVSQPHEIYAPDPPLSSSQHIFTHPQSTIFMASRINSIPAEILGEIFLHYVHDHSFNRRVTPKHLTKSSSRIAAHQDATTSPVLLGHVCAHWRNITLSTSLLWSSVCAIGPEARHLPLFKLWMERSRSCLLDVTVIQHRRKQGREDGVIGVLSCALSQIQRWRSVTLDLYGEGQNVFSNMHTAFAPRLEEVNVNLQGWNLANMDGLYRTFYTSPSLRRVNWGPSVEDGVLTGAPWEQLTHIEINHLISVDLFSILPHCLHLVHLAVVSIDSESNCDNHLRILLPCLQTLDLHYLDDASFIFNRLTLPSLTSLSLSRAFGFMCTPSEGWSSLSNLITRSRCKLWSFTWMETDPDEVLLSQNLSSENMDNLRILKIPSIVTDRTLHALTLNGGCGALPQLQTLTLGECSSVDGALSAMILSRTFPNAPSTTLKSVSANLRGTSHPLDLSLQVPDVPLKIHLLC